MDKTVTNPGNYFEVTAKYVRKSDDKAVKESFTVMADSFGEAEKTVTEHLAFSECVSDISITAVRRARYGEIISKDIDYEDSPYFFLCSVAYILIDEDSGKEKKTKKFYLVGASDIDEAKSMMNDFIKGDIDDSEILSISFSPIQEVIAKETEHEEGTE